jgi:hypothetical protein
MTTFKKLDRKDFLTSTVAALATVTLGGCSSEDSDDGGTETGGTGGTATGGTSGSATGGTATGGTATGGTATGGSAPTGGTGGSGAGGAGGGGGTLTCSNTMSGDHMHPLTIPPSDIERGYQDAPYILQEGGTGHTHTLVLDSYEFVYLNAGVTMEHESSTDAGHSHLVTMDCMR